MRFLPFDLTYGHEVRVSIYEHLLANGFTREDYHFFMNREQRHRRIDVQIEQLNVGGRTVIGERDARGRMGEAAGAAVQRLAETAIKAWLAARPVYRFKDDFKGSNPE